MARPKKPTTGKRIHIQKPKSTNPATEPDPVVETVEEVIQDLENALAGMDIAIQKLQEQTQGITRIVAAKQAVNGIIKNLKPYVG